MPAFEKKLLAFVLKHLEWLFLAVFVLLGLAMRYPLHSLHAAVPGGQGSVFAIVTDLLAAAAGAWLIHRGEGNRWKASILFALLFLSPSAVFSSAVYGHYEGITLGLCIGAFLLLREKKYGAAFGLYGLACLSGFYAWLFLPAFLFCYLYEESFTLLYFGLPAAGTLLRLFAEKAGFAPLGSYLPEGLATEKLYVNCANFWGFLRGNENLLFARYFPLGMILLSALLLGWLILSCRKNRKYEEDGILFQAFLGIAIAAYFLPGADAFSSLYVSVPAWILAVKKPRYLPAALVLEYMSLLPLAGGVYGAEWMPLSLQLQSWIRAAVLLALFAFSLWRSGRGTGDGTFCEKKS